MTIALLYEKKMENKIITRILYVIMFIIPIAESPIEIQPFTSFIRPVILWGCGIFLFIALFKKRKEIVLDKIDKLLLMFWGLLILSTIFSIHKLNAIIGGFDRFEGILSFSTYFLIYFAAKYYLCYDKKIQKYSIYLTIFVCVIGILQYYNFFNPFYEALNMKCRQNHACSTFTNSNFFGSFLSVIAPIYIALYITKGSKKYLLLSLLSFYAIIICLARSSWVALAAVCLVGLIFVIKQADKQFFIRTLHVVIAFILIFMFIVCPPAFIRDILPDSALNKFIQFGNDINSSLDSDGIPDSAGSGRIFIWKLAFKLIPKYPLIGSGPDTFLYASAAQEIEDVYTIFKNNHALADKAHNEYLQYAVTVGIPALIIYLLFVGEILSKQKDILKNNVTLIFSLAIIGYLVQAFFNISTIGVAPIFWLLLGLIQNNKFKKRME